MRQETRDWKACLKKRFGVVKKYVLFRMLFPLVYRMGGIRPVKADRIVLIEVRGDRPDGSFSLIVKGLRRRIPGVKISVVYMHHGRDRGVTYLRNCLRLSWALSDCRAAFLTDACNVLSALPIRRETRVIQLWHGCGAFKKFGFSTADRIWGADQKELERYPNYGNLDLVTVSSPEVIWAYQEAMGIDPARIQALGVSRTDRFFRTGFLQQCRQKVREQIPASKGKKVVLYAPTFRGELEKPQTCTAFPYEAFAARFGEKAVLLVKHHPFVRNLPPIPKACRDVVFDVTEKLEIEELLAASDVCISDYSSLIFEYSLMDRPMLFFTPDLEDYIDWRGFYYPYEEMTPGPVCRDEESLLSALFACMEHFDGRQIKAFRQRFMSACDGHSTRRILDFALSPADRR